MVSYGAASLVVALLLAYGAVLFALHVVTTSRSEGELVPLDDLLEEEDRK